MTIVELIGAIAASIAAIYGAIKGVTAFIKLKAVKNERLNASIKQAETNKKDIEILRDTQSKYDVRQQICNDKCKIIDEKSDMIIKLNQYCETNEIELREIKTDIAETKPIRDLVITLEAQIANINKNFEAMFTNQNKILDKLEKYQTESIKANTEMKSMQKEIDKLGKEVENINREAQSRQTVRKMK